MSNQRQDPILLNTTNVQDNETVPKDVTKPPKKHDTLFGPNIGIVSSGPEWTEASRDKSLVDELTPDIVKGWVAKSKEVLRNSSCPPFSGIDTLPDFPADDYSSSSCESQATQPSTVSPRSFHG